MPRDLKVFKHFILKSYAKIIVFPGSVNVLFYGESPEHF